MSRNSFFFLFAFSAFGLYAQKTDRLKSTESLTDSTFILSDEDIGLFQKGSELDPRRAAILSAILPGLGQVYNKQYWKTPLVYAGLATFGHFISYNNIIYHALRNAVIAQSNGQTHPFSDIVRSPNILVKNRDQFRRNRDYLIILGSFFYVLNIVDAHVSAHLDEFEVNENLTFSLEPSIQRTSFTQLIGVSLVLKI